jgi:hypothetical protein
METTNGNFDMGLVSRAVAFAMAVITTAFLATATAVIFTSAGPFIGA